MLLVVRGLLEAVINRAIMEIKQRLKVLCWIIADCSGKAFNVMFHCWLKFD